MAGELWLVRHAMPALDPKVPAHRWRLSDDGRSAAAALRDVLPQPAYAVASAEPKAIETLRAAGYEQVHVDDGLGEVVRDEPYHGDFAERRRAYLDEGATGWEGHAEVVERFEQALRRARLAAGGLPVVAGTHGMALTLWLAARRRLDRPSLLWETLQTPDVVRIEP